VLTSEGKGQMWLERGDWQAIDGLSEDWNLLSERCQSGLAIGCDVKFDYFKNLDTCSNSVGRS
jgi:hypothetical protein